MGYQQSTMIKIRCVEISDKVEEEVFYVDRDRICQTYPYWRDVTQKQKEYYNVIGKRSVIRYLIDDLSGIRSHLDDNLKVNAWFMIHKWMRCVIPPDIIKKSFSIEPSYRNLMLL